MKKTMLLLTVFILVTAIAHATIPVGAPPPTDAHPIQSLGNELAQMCKDAYHWIFG